MSITTSLAIYFITWWIVLFAVLPWGVRSQSEAGDVVPGSDPGAPASHRVGRTLLWTTVVATIVFGLMWAAYSNGLIPIDYLMSITSPPSTR